MSEENQVEASEMQQEVDTTDYKTLLEQTKAEYEAKLSAIVKKKDELLNETKAAKKEREEASRRALEEAQKNGEFEKLWKESQDRLKQLEQERDSERQEYKKEKINSHAMKLASELAREDGGASAKILSKLLAENIAAIADERGTLTDDLYEAVKKSTMSNKDFAPLLAGNKSTGGGAPGARNSVATNNEMNRESFAKLNPIQQAEFAAKVRAGKAMLID